jgi:hypothetical protein
MDRSLGLLILDLIWMVDTPKEALKRVNLRTFEDSDGKAIMVFLLPLPNKAPFHFLRVSDRILRTQMSLKLPQTRSVTFLIMN